VEPRGLWSGYKNAADDRVEEHGTNMTARDYAELRMLKAESWKEKEKAEVLEMFDRHAKKRREEAAGSLVAAPHRGRLSRVLNLIDPTYVLRCGPRWH
jgi:hypothetical protein